MNKHPKRTRTQKNTKGRPSELRQDPVSLDWVTIATGRAKRANAFAARMPFVHDDPATCPFDNLEKFGNEDPVLQYGRDAAWTLKVVPNKYPAFTGGDRPQPPVRRHGPYHVMEGIGFHEVVVLKDHFRCPAELPPFAIRQLVHAYRERILALKIKDCVNFISIFHNHGRTAGATLTHPHSQLITLPIIPPDIKRSLAGSERYYAEHQQCVHCAMLEHERMTRKRVVFENAHAMVIAPYASHAAFELRIFPKKHEPHFEEMTGLEERSVAEALGAALGALYKGLKNPPYNYFIHTAPPRGKEYAHYHWHMEIVPKTNIWAGFEIGTGIEISPIAPEKSAAFLRRMLA